jgi:hypothetical protein
MSLVSTFLFLASPEARGKKQKRKVTQLTIIPGSLELFRLLLQNSVTVAWHTVEP